jgi:hypothetical protein
MLNVVMLSAIMLCVIMLNVNMLNITMLNGIMPNVYAECRGALLKDAPLRQAHGKGLLGTNALAYLASSLATKKKVLQPLFYGLFSAGSMYSIV